MKIMKFKCLKIKIKILNFKYLKNQLFLTLDLSQKNRV